MENRKPFDLKNIMIVYNFSVVGFSLYLIYEVGPLTADYSILVGVILPLGKTGAGSCL